MTISRPRMTTKRRTTQWHVGAPEPHHGFYLGTNLPHFDPGAINQFITYRLLDSLPAHMADNDWRKFDDALDAGHGNCLEWEGTVRIAEARAARRQAIQVGRIRQWIASETGDARVMLIADQQQNIGLFSSH